VSQPPLSHRYYDLRSPEPDKVHVWVANLVPPAGDAIADACERQRQLDAAVAEGIETPLPLEHHCEQEAHRTGDRDVGASPLHDAPELQALPPRHRERRTEPDGPIVARHIELGARDRHRRTIRTLRARPGRHRHRQ